MILQGKPAQKITGSSIYFLMTFSYRRRIWWRRRWWRLFGWW